jgi:hypothetical protein
MAAVAGLGLILLVAVITGGTALITMKTIDAWRAFRSLQQAMDAVLPDILRKTADVEERLAAVEGATVRLEEAVARLQTSTARAAVLADAFGEVQAASRGVRTTLLRR